MNLNFVSFHLYYCLYKVVKSLQFCPSNLLGFPWFTLLLLFHQSLDDYQSLSSVLPELNTACRALTLIKSTVKTVKCVFFSLL